MTLRKEIKMKILNKFMTMREENIIRMFEALEGSITLPTPYGDCVYIKGTRKDSVLLVSHTDTVWGDEVIEPRVKKGVISSNRGDIGIGADDRAGVAALWELRNSGHSLLIVPEEETGCKGSGYVAEHYKLMFNEQFAIQFDRKGGEDLVFYDCDNCDFENYLTDNYKNYSTATGSFSDICTLCPALGIAGVNISIGFRNEHTSRETLKISEWLRTVEQTKRLLNGDCPKFEYIESKLGWGNWGESSYSVKQSKDGYAADWLYDDEKYVYCHGCQNYHVITLQEDCCPSCGLGEEYLEVE